MESAEPDGESGYLEAEKAQGRACGQIWGPIESGLSSTAPLALCFNVGARRCRNKDFPGVATVRASLSAEALSSYCDILGTDGDGSLTPTEPATNALCLGQSPLCTRLRGQRRASDCWPQASMTATAGNGVSTVVLSRPSSESPSNSGSQTVYIRPGV
jgi:hypothetical protein